MKLKLYYILIGFIANISSVIADISSAYQELDSNAKSISNYRKKLQKNSYEERKAAPDHVVEQFTNAQQVLFAEKYELDLKQRANDEEYDIARKTIITSVLLNEWYLMPFKNYDQLFENVDYCGHYTSVIILSLASQHLFKKPSHYLLSQDELAKATLGELKKYSQECIQENLKNHLTTTFLKSYNPKDVIARILGPDFIRFYHELTWNYNDTPEKFNKVAQIVTKINTHGNMAEYYYPMDSKGITPTLHEYYTLKKSKKTLKDLKLAHKKDPSVYYFRIGNTDRLLVGDPELKIVKKFFDIRGKGKDKILSEALTIQQSVKESVPKYKTNPEKDFDEKQLEEAKRLSMLQVVTPEQEFMAQFKDLNPNDHKLLEKFLKETGPWEIVSDDGGEADLSAEDIAREKEAENKFKSKIFAELHKVDFIKYFFKASLEGKKRLKIIDITQPKIENFE